MPRRGHVALVACELCRIRKVKCDGATPVCGQCRDRDAQCAYPSDPAVSRFSALRMEHDQLLSRHKTLCQLYEQLRTCSSSDASALLERIRSEDRIFTFGDVANVFEKVALSGLASTDADQGVGSPSNITSEPPVAAGPGTFPSSEYDPRNPVLHRVEPAPSACSVNPCAGLSRLGRSVENTADSHVSVSHKVFLWPGIVPHIASGGTTLRSDLENLAKLGSSWLLRRGLTTHPKVLPCELRLEYDTRENGLLFFPNLTVREVDLYSTAYFNTFNRLFPLLDLDDFMDRIVSRVLRQGYRSDDPESVLALLVFALGQLAIEGVLSSPSPGKGGDTVEHSGFRGGTIERPPGLALFNEARQRVGMVNTNYCLEYIQIMLLQATYFEASAQHSDFWSSISAASVACKFLIRSQAIDWSSREGGIIKRAFWICVLHERSFNIEFRIGVTDLEALEDHVPLPHFPEFSHGEKSSETDAYLADVHNTSIDRDDAYHFSAMITLGRLIRRADNVIHEYEPLSLSVEASRQSSGASGQGDAGADTAHFRRRNGPPASLVQELVHQLHCWRVALPPTLRWEDDNRFSFSGIEPLSKLPHTSFFRLLQGKKTGNLNHNTDIAVAHLRTCFYQAQFLIHRPFVYKALHTPDEMTDVERSLCVVCIKAACLWPLSMAPPNDKKHLVPHLFSWTQNYLAMLLILQLCHNNGDLSAICNAGGLLDQEIHDSIATMIRWLEDVRQLDSIADWGCNMLAAGLY